MTAPSPSALLVLGAQRALLDPPSPLIGGEALLGRLRVLVDRARRSGTLIVYLQRDGAPGEPTEPFSKGWTLHNDFRVEPGDLLLRVAGPDAFAGSALDGELHARSVQRLLLAGAGSRALLTTAQRAQALGYEVVLVKDAHSDGDPQAVSELGAAIVGGRLDDLYPETQ